MARIGLLEDNPRISRLSATLLNYAGYEVVIYTTATECLNALFSTKASPIGRVGAAMGEDLESLPIDVLILDLHLPDLGGLKVLSYLQAHPLTSRLPLIFCTAAPRTEIAAARNIAPQATLVEKPFHLQTLVSAVANALETTQN